MGTPRNSRAVGDEGQYNSARDIRASAFLRKFFGVEREEIVKKGGAPKEEAVDEALVRELQWLRKGEGVTLRRLSCAPALLALASGGASVAEPRSEQAIHGAEQLLRRGLESLGHGLGAEALRVALAVDLEDPLTLTQRRHDFAAKHNKHPDTVENHENRTIHELALRLRGLGPPHEDCGSAGDPDRSLQTELALSAPLRGEAEAAGIHLIRSNDDLVTALLSVVETAEHCLATTGSRSRDPEYLGAIEQRVENAGIAHYRVLCGPPHWSVLKDHLRRLVEIKSADPIGGNRRMFIGLVSDFSREPERSLCANEHKAVVVLPSLNGVERYDTALQLEGVEFAMAYVRLVQEMFAGAQSIETAADVAALPLVREG